MNAPDPDQTGYRVCAAVSLEQLTREVEAYMGFHWVPVGAPFFNVRQEQWCQAVTKTRKTPAPSELELRETKRVKH